MFKTLHEIMPQMSFACVFLKHVYDSKDAFLRFLNFLIAQDMLLSTWKMSEMLKMHFEGLTELNLVGRAVDFVLSGVR